MHTLLLLFASLSVLLFAGPVGATVPTLGLVSRWLADGDANDAQGSNHGTLQNGAGFTAGVSGQAFDLDGIDDHVRIPEVPSLEPGTGSFTVDAWVRTDGTATRGSILNYYECGAACPPPDPFSAYFVSVLDTGVAEGRMRDKDSGSSLVVVGNRPIADGEFHHVALLRDTTAGDVKLFVDGVLDASAPVGTQANGFIGDVDPESDPLTLGVQRDNATGDPINPFEGAIDDVKYYSRALTSLEVLEIAREFLPGRFVASWKEGGRAIQAIGGGLDPALLVALSLEPVGVSGPTVTTPDSETVVLTYSGFDPNPQLQINVASYGLPFYPPDPVKVVGNQLQFEFDDAGTMATLTIDVVSSSGGVVDPLSLVGFNPQPEPPAAGLYAYIPPPSGPSESLAGAISLTGGSGASGATQISLSLQVLDDSLVPLPTAPVAMIAPTMGPAALAILAAALGGLAIRRLSRQRTRGALSLR